MDNEEVTLEEKVEEPVEVVVEETPAPPAPEPEEDVQQTLLQLRKQLEDARNAQAQAEQERYQAQQQAYQARIETKDTNLQLVINAIHTVKTNTDILENHYAEAMSAGDYNRAAQIQREMANNEAKLLQLENGKAAMEEEAKRPAAPPPLDPVEALASQLTPRSAEWIRRHPQFVRDQRLFKQMEAAHTLAVSRGIQADTDEYFADVESTLRIQPPKPAEPEDPMEYTAKVTQRRAAPPAAPVSRGENRSTVVRLSSEEREIAQMMKMTPEEYAKNKTALQRAGKIK